jgi:hypothetical protein
LVYNGDKRINLIEIAFKIENEISIEGSLSNLVGFPNPFSTTFDLLFKTNEDGRVSIHMLNILGQRVDIIQQDAEFQAGEYRLNWNGDHLKEGTYFVQLFFNGKPSAILPLIKQN